MIIEIKDWNNVINIEPTIHGDDIYTIAIEFIDGAISLAFSNRERFTKEYKRLLKDWRNDG